MTYKQISNLAKLVANLDGHDQLKILRSETPKEVADTLKQVGYEIPASNWLLVVVKIVLFALGLILAGVGTSSAATLML